MILIPVQCRMARAALDLGIRELARAAKVSIDTITRFERGDQLKERTVDAIQRALEAAGVEFTNGEQPGVRLTKATAPHLRKADHQDKTIVAKKAARERAAKRSKKRA
jgi:transcriptional regulator with XRE-family HTH domain